MRVALQFIVVPKQIDFTIERKAYESIITIILKNNTKLHFDFD